MSFKIILLTLVVEAALGLLLVCNMAGRRRAYKALRRVQCEWELVPYDFKSRDWTVQGELDIELPKSYRASAKIDVRKPPQSG